MADSTLPTIRTFQVFPDIPEKLQPLLELAQNLWWVWHPDAVELFRRLDRKLWEQVYHNPVKLLGAIPQDKLAEAAKDDGYLAHLNRVHEAFKEHLQEHGWFHQTSPAIRARCWSRISRRSSALHESLPIYSGGLGMLAGDHLKIAPASSACRWWRWGCSIATAISSSISPATAGSRKRIRSWISTTCRSSR